MRKSTAAIITCLLFTVSLSAQKTTAIKCGKLLDTKTGQTLSNQIILVKGNLVEGIVAAADFKQKADSVIDLSSYYVLPGLIDCHIPCFIAGAVLPVRTMMCNY